ncbi:hypothetical protein PUN28_015949 [Cardiocondyla obscurior]|uniref:Uncharacterized protein n=1 Tax=Cardiocondyla obscurior TaxID=286306 RepID=A0AAW2ESW1_9HYME
MLYFFIGWCVCELIFYQNFTFSVPNANALIIGINCPFLSLVISNNFRRNFSILSSREILS